MEYVIIAFALVGMALAAFAGHAVGYMRRGEVERKRQLAAINGGPSYMRSGFTHVSPSQDLPVAHLNTIQLYGEDVRRP